MLGQPTMTETIAGLPDRDNNDRLRLLARASHIASPVPEDSRRRGVATDLAEMGLHLRLSPRASPWHNGCAANLGCLPSFEVLSRLHNLSPAPAGLFLHRLVTLTHMHMDPRNYPGALLPVVRIDECDHADHRPPLVFEVDHFRTHRLRINGDDAQVLHGRSAAGRNEHSHRVGHRASLPPQKMPGS